MLALGLHSKHILHMRQYVFAPILFLEFDIGVRAYKRFYQVSWFHSRFFFFLQLRGQVPDGAEGPPLPQTTPPLPASRQQDKVLGVSY